MEEVLLFADVLATGELIRNEHVFWVRGPENGCEPRIMESGSTSLRPLTESEMNACWPADTQPFRNERVLHNGVGIIPLRVGPRSQRRSATWKKINKKWIGHLNETLSFVNGDAFVAPAPQSVVVLPPDFLNTRKRKRVDCTAEAKTEPKQKAARIHKLIEDAYFAALTNHVDDMEKSALWNVETVDDFLKLQVGEIGFAKHILEFYHVLVKSGRVKRV